MKTNHFKHVFKNLFANSFFLQRRIHTQFILRKEVKKNIKSNPRLKHPQKNKAYLEASRTFLKSAFSGYKNTNWHFYISTLTNIKKVEYIPEDLFYNKLEPLFNKTEFAPAIADKLSLDTLFRREDMPQTIFKILSGRFYDDQNNFVDKETALESLKNIENKVVLKPAAYLGGGNQVVVDSAPGMCFRLQKKHYLKGSYILQDFVKQHPVTAQFHPNSLNTFRITTARVDSDIVVISAFLRTGTNNTEVDNGQMGGILCKVNNNGVLGKPAIDKKGNFYEKHPNSGIKFEGIKIPGYGKLVEFCLENHKRFLRFTFIAWDMAIQENGKPVFIEFNLRKQGIVTHQILNGPLFGENTQHFIHRYQAEKDRQQPPQFIL